MTRLVEWTNDWFLDLTGNIPVEAIERRPRVFVAVVVHLFDGLRKRPDFKLVHNMLTFLLRGWNPLTAEVEECVPSATAEDPDPIFTPCYKGAVKELMDFTKPPSRSAAYRLLGQFAMTARTAGSKIQSSFCEERKTLLLLSIWLITRQEDILYPDDIHLVRECLRLYKLSNTVGCTDMLTEYCGGSPKIGWQEWLLENVNYALSSDKPIGEAFSDIVYLAMFVCLLRAYRCTENELSSRMDVSNHLDVEISLLRQYQDDYKMSLEGPSRPSRMVDVYGIKPKKKQPKITQTNIGGNN